MAHAERTSQHVGAARSRGDGGGLLTWPRDEMCSLIWGEMATRSVRGTAAVAAAVARRRFTTHDKDGAAVSLKP